MSKLRILVLTSSTGGGHDARAEAFAEWCFQLYRHDVDVRIEQMLEKSSVVNRTGVNLYNRIQRAAPESTVYVVGYPDILPTEGTCDAVGVSADVLGPVTDVAGVLNASLEKGATAAGASYIDMETLSEGHDVCAKGRAWVNGPRFRAGVAAPFHPKINGMRAVAAELYRTITGEEPETTEYAEPDPDVVVLNE